MAAASCSHGEGASTKGGPASEIHALIDSLVSEYENKIGEPERKNACLQESLSGGTLCAENEQLRAENQQLLAENQRLCDEKEEEDNKPKPDNEVLNAEKDPNRKARHSMLSLQMWSSRELTQVRGASTKTSATLIEEYFPRDPMFEQEQTEGILKWMIIVISLNSLFIGIQCEWPGEEGSALSKVYYVIDALFLVCYTIELVIKLKTTGLMKQFAGEESKWNIFDFFLWISMASDMVLLISVAPADIRTIVRPLRLLRVIRCVRILRSLRAVPSLAVVVGGLWGSLWTLGWIIIVLLILIYTFGIFFYLTLDNDFEKVGYGKPWENLFSSIRTLCAVTVLNIWDDVVPESHWYLRFPFYVFVMLASFGVTNIVVGVIVDATAETKTKIQFNERRKHLRKAGEMWEEHIRGAGLGLDSLAGLHGEELEAKKQQRRSRIEEIMQGIIETSDIPLPHGVKADEMIRLIDPAGTSELDLHTFILGMGRIYLGDNLQLSMHILMNQGTTRKLLHDLHDGQSRLAANQKRLLEKVQEQMAGTDETLKKMMPFLDCSGQVVSI